MTVPLNRRFTSHFYNNDLPIIDYTVVEDDAVRDVDIFADDAMLADDTSLHRSLFADLRGFADEAVACIRCGVYERPIRRGTGWQ